MNDEHDNLGNPAEEIASIPGEHGYVKPSPPAWEDLHALNRRLAEAEIEIEKLRDALAKAQANDKAAWAARDHLVAEMVDTDKALKDALALIGYLASRG